MSSSPIPAPLPRSSGRGFVISLWIVQVLLAAVFLLSGVMKFVMPVEQMTKGNSLPGWFIHFIGVAEIAGALGLVLPTLLHIKPILTPIAACCLFIIMVGATYVSLPKGAMAVAPAVIGLLCAFVAYGRFRLGR